jgi:hypothetical protein
MGYVHFVTHGEGRRPVFVAMRLPYAREHRELSNSAGVPNRAAAGAGEWGAGFHYGGISSFVSCDPSSVPTNRRTASCQAAPQ